MECLKKSKKLYKKSKEKNHTSTKLFLVLVFFCLSFFSYPTTSNSYSIEPAIEEFILQISQDLSSSIRFTNTTEEKQEFKVYTHRYNPKDQKILEEKNFINLKTTLLSLEPNETGKIDYEINIPDDVIPGSYFSIIVVEDIQEETNNTGGIALNYGVGSLIAAHIVSSIDITEIFLTETETNLTFKRPLNPFNTILVYSIKNNSKYTFLPTGQITIASAKEIPVFLNINSEELRLYPNDELNFEITYEGRIKDLITNKIALAKIGSQYSNEAKENQIDLPYLTQTIRIAAAVIGFVVVLTISIVSIKKNQEKSLKKIFKEKISKRG